jgi:hypothetical protein
VTDWRIALHYSLCSWWWNSRLRAESLLLATSARLQKYQLYRHISYNT